MKIVDAGYEILDPLNGEEILKKIERVARVCYKSEDKITEGSAEKMVRALIKSNHMAMLEHYSFSVKFICDRGVSHSMAGTGDNMKNDHQYAEVLEMMRSQGAKDNPTLAQIGVMQSSNSVKIDDLVLNAEDLYIADYLVAGYTRQIKVPYVAGVSVDTTQSNGFASKDNPDPDTRVWKQSQITYTDGLKAGDMVLVQKLNDNNKYVIIARVVEA